MVGVGRVAPEVQQLQHELGGPAASLRLRVCVDTQSHTHKTHAERERDGGGAGFKCVKSQSTNGVYGICLWFLRWRERGGGGGGENTYR